MLTLTEGPRGCGHRKVGGLYVMGGRLVAPCGKMPLPLTVCPTCHQGIKPSRGWTWIEPKPLFDAVECRSEHDIGSSPCRACPAHPDNLPKKAGLLWIGERFYKTPEAFLAEASVHGISRRVSQLPKAMVVGTTRVFLAHRKAIQEHCGECVARSLPGIFTIDPDCPDCDGEGYHYTAGIFAGFTVTEVQKVVDPNEVSDEELEKLEKRQITPVQVVPVEEWPA